MPMQAGRGQPQAYVCIYIYISFAVCKFATVHNSRFVWVVKQGWDFSEASGPGSQITNLLITETL